MQDPIMDITGIGAGDGSGVARNHDRYLYHETKKVRGRLMFPEMDRATWAALVDELPIGLIFADEHDVTVLYNREAQRIFRRTLARVAEILGTSVVECHSPQSRDTVRQLLDDFRAGRRDELDGVEDVNGRLVRITYRPVRAPDGCYLGVVEIAREVEPKA